MRWDEDHPRIGVDPDVYVVEPPPPEGDAVTSLRLWETGHHPPLVAVEVVSPNHPYKDDEEAPDKYAACGASELWVFDPQLAGPRAHGGPFRIQLWRRAADGALERTYASDGPSPAIGGWLVPVDHGKRLRLASDPDGLDDRRGRRGERPGIGRTRRGAQVLRGRRCRLRRE